MRRRWREVRNRKRRRIGDEITRREEGGSGAASGGNKG